QEPAITPQAAPRKVLEVIMAESNQVQKEKERAATAPRSLSGHIQSQPQSLQPFPAVQQVPDPGRLVKNFTNSYLTVRKFWSG
ncbi:hypothetical protein O181_116953, partial [Austropuccinia psidii MF-1]|nr:hypothetical protein [Austropuccinia psidii MF-1]